MTSSVRPTSTSHPGVAGADAYAAFPGIATAIDRYLRPRIEGLLGIAPLTPDCDGFPETGHPCHLCGAIRDAAGKVISVEVRDPLTGEPLGTITTGIREGDHLACVACTCLEPSRERAAKRHGKPVRHHDPKKTPAPPRLTLKDRRNIARKPSGWAWLTMKDAEESGDVETAGLMQTFLYRIQDGQLDEPGLAAELGSRFPDSPWGEKLQALSA